MSLPIAETWFSFTGIFVLAIVIGYVTFLLISRLVDLFRKKDAKKHHDGCFGCLVRVLVLAAFFWFGTTMLALAVFTRSYYKFTDQKLVAEVICEPTTYQDYTMHFSITKRHGRDAGKTYSYYLRGERWFVEGDILKWRPVANFLGLETMYRLSKVGGDFWRVEDQKMNPQSIETLANDRLPTFWQWLYNYGNSLPFVQDVYSDRVAKPPARGRKFNIYVTTSGFSLETINLE